MIRRHEPIAEWRRNHSQEVSVGFVNAVRRRMTMAGAARRTDPELWERVKQKVTAGEKGGRPGQWSARKAQLAVADYKKAGGGYIGNKDPNNLLTRWTREDWGTKSGEKSSETGERYLPKKTRARLSDEEYGRTTAKKRSDTSRGRQFSRQPKDVADKSGNTRLAEAPLAELRRRAAARQIAGRSRMTKQALVEALS
jgi:hypothetical protein